MAVRTFGAAVMANGAGCGYYRNTLGKTDCRHPFRLYLKQASGTGDAPYCKRHPWQLGIVGDDYWLRDRSAKKILVPFMVGYLHRHGAPS